MESEGARRVEELELKTLVSWELDGSLVGVKLEVAIIALEYHLGRSRIDIGEVVKYLRILSWLWRSVRLYQESSIAGSHYNKHNKVNF